MNSLYLKHPHKALLIVILVIALIVRINAIYPGHPHNHPDEPFVYDRAADMVMRHSIDPMKYYYYQILPMYVHAAIYSGVFVPATILQKFIFQPNEIANNVFDFDTYVGTNIVRPNSLYWGRLVVALIGVLSIVIFYVLAKEIYDIPTALIAAFLLTFNYRHFLSSVLSLNDIPNALVTLLMMLLLVRQFKRPTANGTKAMGILTGIVFSTKFQPFIFIPVCTTLLLRALQPKSLHTRKKLENFIKEVIFTMFIGAVVIVVINILPIIHWKEFQSFLSDVGVRNTVGKISFRLYPYWFIYTIGIGPILSWLVFMGITLSLIKKETRKPTLIILSYLVWVFIFLSYYSSGGMFVRYFVPVIPLMLLFASYIIRNFSFFLVRFIPVHVIFIGLVLAIVFNFRSTSSTLVGSYYYNQPSSLSCASEWVNNSLPEKSKIGIYPPAPMDAINSKKIDWVYFNQRTDFTLPELQDKNIEYVVINLSRYSNYFIRWVMQGTRYWDMPTEIFENMLPGLVIKELMNNIVYGCVKPMPAPDDNIIVVKVPERVRNVINNGDPTNRKMLISTISDWRIFPTNFSGLGYTLSEGENCYTDSCVEISAAKTGPYDFVTGYANYGTPLFFPPRLESPTISIEPGKIYQFNARVKPQKTIPLDRRDGFFRMDFYTSDENYRARKSDQVFVSKRVTGDDWQQISFNGIATREGKYLTVSFQTEYFQDTYLIDTFDLSQYDLRAKDMPQIKTIQIDKEILYPRFIL